MDKPISYYDLLMIQDESLISDELLGKLTPAELYELMHDGETELQDGDYIADYS